MNRAFLICLLLFIACPGILGQLNQVYIDKNLDSRPLIELIRYAEDREDIKFFYLRKWIDSITVIQKEIPSSLEKILTETLSKTSLTWFADNKNIIITSGYRIETKLPESFVSQNKILPAKPPEESSFIRKEQSLLQADSKQIQPDLIIIGTPGKVPASERSTISGVITEKETGQPIIGAVVFLDKISQGTITDNYGYYILSVQNGRHELNTKYLGRKDQSLRLSVIGSGVLNIAMEEKLLELRGVVITADKDISIKSLQLGLEKLDIQTIKQVSSAIGEGDLMKTALLLPGVKTVGEGASGFNVRGGSTDQNLILMDGSPVFNSSHIFGFFSVFNQDVVKEFKLYKSGIPTQYGGRLSSVLDVGIKSGSLKKVSFYGGISPVAARLTLEGPIIKDKASFLISSRGSYSDWILRRTKIPSLVNSNASFLDLNVKLDFNFNDKNHLTISSYYSADHFRLNSDTLYNYGNLIASVNFKHTFSKKLYGIAALITSNYSYSVGSNNRPPYAFDLSYFINYLEGRTDFTWFLNSAHKINFGANVIDYRTNPGSMNPAGKESIILPRKVPDENAAEAGIYLSDEFNVTDAFSINMGLRYSGFFTLGPKLVYDYLPGVPRSLQTRIDSTDFGRNRIADYQGGPEFRFSARYSLGPASSVKISYARMNQYLQMISNTTAISPTDIWITSGPNLPAQKSRQISAGFYRYLMDNKLLTSIELYYKTSENIIEYRGNTLILMNPNLEIDLLRGRGKAYGVELMLRKEYGAFNGWIGYTYSRSFLKVDSKFIEDQINQGKYFPANYDKPHDFTIVANYRFSRIHSISTTLTYNTGRPITYPVARYQFRGREFLHYSNRNEYRIPDYLRWDVSLNIDGKLKTRNFMQNSVSISVYNATNRANAYSIYFVSDLSRNVKGYKLSVFSQSIITVTYNFRF